VPSTSTRLILVSLIIAGSFGCVSTPAPSRLPDPSLPPEPEQTPLPSTPTRSPLAFVYRDGVYAYDLQQQTIVTVGSDGALPLEDTLRTRGVLTYSIAAISGAPAVSVTVDSLAIASVRDTTTPVRYLMAPVVVQLPIVRPPLVTAEDTLAFLSTCDSMDETARVLAADLHITIPVPIQETQSWVDSTSRVLCRGSIPLAIVQVSRYQIASVRETRDSSVATVSRQTSLTVGGTGMQGSRRITVRGEGTSNASFLYDVRAGRFLESRSESLLQLAFETIQQTEQVVQRSTSTARLRSATPAGGN
jgi:hypothetical protein